MRSRDWAWKAAAVISGLFVSAAYALAGNWVLAAIPLALTVLFLAATHLALGLRSTIFLATGTALAAVGIHLQLSVPLLVMGTAAALAAWDLAHFAERLALAVSDEQRALLQRAHLPSLVVAIASGLGLAVLASFVRLQIPFGVVSLLALVLVLALAGIPRAIRSGGRRS